MVVCPQLFRVRQRFQAPRVDDVAAEVHTALGGLELAAKVADGQSVAITGGSRGIANIDVIIRSIAEHLKGFPGVPGQLLYGCHLGNRHVQPPQEAASNRLCVVEALHQLLDLVLGVFEFLLDA